MRITARLIIHYILPMDGIGGEGRIERMSPKGIKKKPSKSFNQDFPTAFYYHYQRVISIIVTSIIYIKIVGKCICIYSMIQCLMHEHTTHAQSILCFDIMYLQVCSFYYVASLLYINYIAKLRILLRINKFLYIKMKSHTLKCQYFIYFQYPTLGDANIELCKKFRYLLTAKQLKHTNHNVSRNSAVGYYSTFRALLKIAYTKKMFRENFNSFLEKISCEVK